MKFAKACFLTVMNCGFLFFLSPQVTAAVLNVPADHATIQAAITAAAPGDTITIDNGIYAETLNITKSLTITGQSEAGVIINTPDVNARAVEIAGVNNVTVENLTINRPANTNCTPANATTCFGFKVENSSGHLIQNVTVNNSPRTAIDFNGVDNSTLNNVTLNNTIFGAGIGLTDSDNNTLSNITTTGNAFSGIAIFTSTFFPPAGSSGNNLTGTNSINEPTPIYYQKANAADPVSFDATPDYNFVILNNTPGTETLGFYADTLANAVTGAEALEVSLGNNPASTVVIQDLNNPATTYPDSDPVTAGYQSGDIFPPVFDSLNVIGRDAGNVTKTPIMGTTYVGIGENLLFDINISPDDTVGTGNSFISFSIGADSLQTANFVGTGTPTSERTRTYNILPGQNGAVGITGVTFKDMAGNDITGVPPLPIATTIVVDTTAPTLTSVVQSTNNIYRDKWAREGEVITYDLTFSEPVTVTVNTPSSGTNVSLLTQEVDSVLEATDQLIFTAAAGDNGVVTINVDFDITDRAGNVTTINSLGTITSADGSAPVETDTTNPTMTSVSIASDNANSAWAKSGDTITITTAASELLRTGLTQTVIGTIAGEATIVTGLCGGTNCQNHEFALLTDGNEPEGVTAFTLNFQDRAGNPGVAVTTTTDASSVTIDNTAPTTPLVSIASNNALDTTLAKSNDTITVTYTAADNLATMLTLEAGSTILSSPAVGSPVTLGAGNTIARFTDGSETSEVVVPFNFTITDQAGNSTTTTAVTDGSQVQFDRTEPVLRRVHLRSFSADSSAFEGDAPQYYAKQGDRLRLRLQICDYVDSNNNPPTGTFFGQAVVFADDGLVGAPGNCTTGAGNLSQWRRWQAIIDPADGVEGFVTFSVDPMDNAGNTLVPSVTATTNGSSIIFDKTDPVAPTDMVDLGGAETLGYKPSPDAALYTWTNDTDPMGGPVVSGVYQFNIRYNNPNTGINEMVTITEPTRSFAPTAMIPDLDPYTVNMEVRDKAGNVSTEAVVYTQRYGIEVTGKVVDNQTSNPIEGAIVNVIAPAGGQCNLPGQEVCGDATDAQGNYTVVVAPNTDYKLDATKTPNYYIAKSDLEVLNTDVVSNIRLEPVEEGEIQTGNQGTVITTDAEFSLNSIPQTTYITAFSQSGEVSAVVTPEGIQITSFGTITGVTSNNPNVVIQDQGNNTFLVRNAGNILNVSDNQNRGSSVSSSFASGSNGVGVRRSLGGASAGFQSGIRREDRVVNARGWTYAESMAFARMMNQGTDYQVFQRTNRNGFTVFGGYRHGRMAMSDMTGANPMMKINKQVIYRGPRRGMENTYRNVAVEDRREIVESLFEDRKPNETEALVVESDTRPKASRPYTITKKTEFAHDNPEIEGFGRPESVYPGVFNKRQNDANYVNKFARTVPPAEVAESRMRGKNVNMIVFRNGNQRSSNKLRLGQLFNENPQLITSRERVVRQ